MAGWVESGAGKDKEMLQVRTKGELGEVCGGSPKEAASLRYFLYN